MNTKLQEVYNRFEKNNLSTDVILPNIKLLDRSSKDSPAFNDPRYLPFYYRLGCELSPSCVIQIGSKLGLIGASFLRGCKTVQEWHIFNETKGVSGIVESNLKLMGCHKIDFSKFESENFSNQKFEQSADIAFLTEKFESKKTEIYLEFLWGHLKTDCFLVVDYIEDETIKESFHKFCSIKNRKPVLFNTRYGVGVLAR